MTYTVGRVVPHPAERSAPLRALPTLVLAGVVTAVSVLLVVRWWGRIGPAGTPTSAPQLGGSWEPYLYQLPGGVLVAVLLARSFRPAEDSSVSQRLSTVTARWGWVWAGSSAVWVVLTASSITGVPVRELAARSDLWSLLAGNDHIVAHVTTLWVAMAVALFGARLAGGPTTAAMVLLIVVGTVLPGTGYALGNQHEHLARGAHALFSASIAARLCAAVLWLGVMITLLHLRREPGHVRRLSPVLNAVVAAAALTVGLSIIGVHTSSLLSSPSSGKMAAGSLLAAQTLVLVLLAVIGWRHRRRTADAVAPGLSSSLGLLAGELVLLLATIGVAAGAGVSA